MKAIDFKENLEYWKGYVEGKNLSTDHKKAAIEILEIIIHYESSDGDDLEYRSSNRVEVGDAMFSLYLQLNDRGALEAYAMQNLL